MIFSSIDPGFNGGISIFNDLNCIYCDIMPIEENLKGKNKINGKIISELFKTNKVEYVILEHVHAFAGQGRTSIWNFGEGVGMIKGVCEALNIKYEEVSPMKWKKIVLGEEYKHDDKSGSIKFCQDFYPNINLLKSSRCRTPHDGKSDSICIGHYYKTINKII